MRLLGLDYGEARIGVALSDELGIIASPHSVIEIKRSRKKAFNDIKALIEANGVQTVVVGYPLNMNGTHGPRAEATDEFCAELQRRNPDITIVKWDERLTTKAADRTLIELGKSTSEKGANDRIAAALILQGYLDSTERKKQ